METKIFNLDQIKNALDTFDPVQANEEGFVAYSQGRVVVPPVGELLFDNPPGDAHIKYGYIKGDEYFVIKVATGYYDNIKLGIPTNTGLMLLFTQKTGEVAGVLLDEGYLTNVRTACAGAVAAKYLAPKKVERIGVFGAGVQGRMQLQYLKSIVRCREVMIWGISEEECLRYKEDMEAGGFNVEICLDPGKIAGNCNLIVTATPSKKPLLKADQIRKGTHITAMGSDTPEKNELDSHILNEADVVVGDSLEQCKSRGEIFKAVSAGISNAEKPVELGDVIAGKAAGRTSDDQITIADLTGVAVQDIQITVGVYKALTGSI
ncbi:ornithine cyclodeaminase family protein [Acidobacteriota bacterium]